MKTSYSYESVLAAAERVSFRLDDILLAESTLDFSRRFLPTALVGAGCARLLSAEDQLLHNQIFAHTYLCMFELVEEFILPFLIDHTRPTVSRADLEVRALLTFASEEAKHIALFKRFRSAFERGFGMPCPVVGPSHEVAMAVLAHSPLAVALNILHIEWMTQRHYLESVRSDEGLEPHIKELLKAHWLEEAQHAKMDTLIAMDLASKLPQNLIDAAVDEYLHIVSMVDALLVHQTELDIDSLARARDEVFSEPLRAQLREHHLAALRATFISAGMSHPNFLSTLGSLSPRGAARVRQSLSSMTTTIQQGDAA